MFHNQTDIDLLSPSREPGHQARFREELDDSDQASHKSQPEDVDLLLAQHHVNAGTFVRFV